MKMAAVLRKMGVLATIHTRSQSVSERFTAFDSWRNCAENPAVDCYARMIHQISGFKSRYMHNGIKIRCSTAWHSSYSAQPQNIKQSFLLLLCHYPDLLNQSSYISKVPKYRGCS